MNGDDIIYKCVAHSFQYFNQDLYQPFEQSGEEWVMGMHARPGSSRDRAPFCCNSCLSGSLSPLQSSQSLTPCHCSVRRLFGLFRKPWKGMDAHSNLCERQSIKLREQNGGQVKWQQWTVTYMWEVRGAEDGLALKGDPNSGSIHPLLWCGQRIEPFLS
jgi:hypothetical protein